MRSFTAFLLLLALFVLGGCGGSSGTSGDPADVVTAWNRAINAGDSDAAADLFADNVQVIQGGQATTLTNRDDAVAFNAALPCGGKIVEQTSEGETVTATFVLTRRPGQRCDGAGQSAVAAFKVVDGKIVLWHQLPTAAAAVQAA